MELGSLSGRSGQILIFAACFLIALVLDAIRHPGPLNEAEVNNNNGSRMTFIVTLAGLAFLYFLGKLLILFLMVKLNRGDGLGSLALAFPVMTGLLGLGYGRAVLLRAKDAGMDRRQALAAIVPFANLWVAFAPPKQTRFRPPYRPSNVLLRANVAVLAIAFVLFLDWLTPITRQMLVDIRIADKIETGDIAHGASVPKTMATVSKLSGIEARIDDGVVSYEYELTGSAINPDQIQDWLDRSKRLELVRAWCADPSFTGRPWQIRYVYWRGSSSEMLAELILNSRDCKDIGS